MRKNLFLAAYWATSIFFTLTALPLLLLPGRALLMAWMRFYASAMVFWMRTICGVTLEIRGRHHVPNGAAIIAAKHQSWGDGFCMFSQFADLSFVTGDHLEKMPLVGSILKKMGAVVVASCGGVESRARVTEDGIGKAKAEGRKILIYPEGRIVPAGLYYPYKKGVFHMHEGQDCPVVPVATNLGLFWPKDEWNLKSGYAVVEFLEPIAPGLGKDAFMALLHERIETASLALLPADFKIPANRVWADPSDVKSAQRESVAA